MKRLLFVTIFILTGLYVFAQDAFIEELTGTVEIKQSKDASFKTANKGDKIFKDTVIATSFKSYAIIKIGGTTITVRPLTTLTLAEIQKIEETETLNVNLQSGRVRVDVKPAAGTKALTTVSSPSSTASVRGTSFEFDTNNLYVNEGKVSFAGNNGQYVIVSAGGSSQVDQTGQVTTPRDERTANLMPPSPVGTSAREMSASTPAAANTPFTFELEYQP
ncbi:hypothetical protein R84B8_02322 [Treponema sp. R8-4-B8]